MSNITPGNNFQRVLVLLETHHLGRYANCAGCAIPLSEQGVTIESHQANLLQAAGLIKPDAGTLET